MSVGGSLSWESFSQGLGIPLCLTLVSKVPPLATRQSTRGGRGGEDMMKKAMLRKEEKLYDKGTISTSISSNVSKCVAMTRKINLIFQNWL